MLILAMSTRFVLIFLLVCKVHEIRGDIDDGFMVHKVCAGILVSLQGPRDWC